jgi:hypothetical protein
MQNLAFIHLNNAYGSETVLHTWAADVKEMYDWLPQDDIIKAIKWVLDYVKRRYRRDYVSVNFKSTKSSHLGRSYECDEFVNLSFEMLFSICVFEISNALFTFNKSVFLQTLGVPIGAPGAPGYSMAVCIYFEHQFRTSIYDHSRFIFFFRYFDDLRAIVAYRSSDLSSKKLAYDLLKRLLTKTYHPSMILELEDCEPNSCNFLEGQLSIQKDYFSVMWRSKNLQSLLENGTLKFITSQDFFSYTGDKRKIVRAATLSGRLSTLLGYSFSDTDLLQSFGSLLPELFARGYTKKCISSACYKMLKRTKEPIWRVVLLMINCCMK